MVFNSMLENNNGIMQSKNAIKVIGISVNTRKFRFLTPKNSKTNAAIQANARVINTAQL